MTNSKTQERDQKKYAAKRVRFIKSAPKISQGIS